MQRHSFIQPYTPSRLVSEWAVFLVFPAENSNLVLIATIYQNTSWIDQAGRPTLLASKLFSSFLTIWLL